jgi:hypothetical protein
VPGEHVDGDSTVGLVFGYAHLGLKRGQHNAEIVVLDQGSGVLTCASRRFRLQAMDFGREVELHDPLGHGRCVRSMMGFVLRSVGHSEPPGTPRYGHRPTCRVAVLRS